LVSAARDGDWASFKKLLGASDLSVDMLNTVPPGRSWGVIHQVSYWGEASILNELRGKYPTLSLEVDTAEDAAQSPLDIATGRGHADFCAELRATIDASKVTAGSHLSSMALAPSAAMKVPVAMQSKLCNICYSEEHAPGTLGVGCDNDHFLCQECFCSYVDSESDTTSNPQSVFEKGGRVNCVQKIAAGCDSNAFANKLIAMVVSDELYEKYLRARDFVV